MKIEALSWLSLIDGSLLLSCTHSPLPDRYITKQDKMRLRLKIRNKNPQMGQDILALCNKLSIPPKRPVKQNVQSMVSDSSDGLLNEIGLNCSGPFDGHRTPIGD